MSIILRMQNLPWSASSADIRKFFTGVSIPDGGVHIVGGELGDVFIAFTTDDDARRAFGMTNKPLCGSKVTLMLSSKNEMMEVITQSRQAASKDVFSSSAPSALSSQAAAAVPEQPSASGYGAARYGYRDSNDAGRQPSTSAPASRPMVADYGYGGYQYGGGGGQQYGEQRYGDQPYGSRDGSRQATEPSAGAGGSNYNQAPAAQGYPPRMGMDRPALSGQPRDPYAAAGGEAALGGQPVPGRSAEPQEEPRRAERSRWDPAPVDQRDRHDPAERQDRRDLGDRQDRHDLGERQDRHDLGERQDRRDLGDRRELGEQQDRRNLGNRQDGPRASRWGNDPQDRGGSRYGNAGHYDDYGRDRSRDRDDSRERGRARDPERDRERDRDRDVSRDRDGSKERFSRERSRGYEERLREERPSSRQSSHSHSSSVQAIDPALEAIKKASSDAGSNPDSPSDRSSRKAPLLDSPMSAPDNFPMPRQRTSRFDQPPPNQQYPYDNQGAQRLQQNIDRQGPSVGQTAAGNSGPDLDHRSSQNGRGSRWGPPKDASDPNLGKPSDTPGPGAAQYHMDSNRGPEQSSRRPDDFSGGQSLDRGGRQPFHQERMPNEPMEADNYRADQDKPYDRQAPWGRNDRDQDRGQREQDRNPYDMQRRGQEYGRYDDRDRPFNRFGDEPRFDRPDDRRDTDRPRSGLLGDQPGPPSNAPGPSAREPLLGTPDMATGPPLNRPKSLLDLPEIKPTKNFEVPPDGDTQDRPYGLDAQAPPSDMRGDLSDFDRQSNRPSGSGLLGDRPTDRFPQDRDDPFRRRDDDDRFRGRDDDFRNNRDNRFQDDRSFDRQQEPGFDQRRRGLLMTPEGGGFGEPAAPQGGFDPSQKDSPDDDFISMAWPCGGDDEEEEANDDARQAPLLGDAPGMPQGSMGSGDRGMEGSRFDRFGPDSGSGGRFGGPSMDRDNMFGGGGNRDRRDPFGMDRPDQGPRFGEDRSAPPFGGPQRDMDRPQQDWDRRGPNDMDRRGPNDMDRRGPNDMDRRGPNDINRWGAPGDMDMGGPPRDMDRQGPHDFDRQGGPFRDFDRGSGPPRDFDRQEGPPRDMDHQGGPPRDMDRRGPQNDMDRWGPAGERRDGMSRWGPAQDGPPQDMDRRGPPPQNMDRHGPPSQDMDRRAPTLQDMDRRGPPPDMDRRGPPPSDMDRRGPPPSDMDGRGPPPDMNRRGPSPHDMRGPPPHNMERQGPPPHEMESHSPMDMDIEDEMQEGQGDGLLGRMPFDPNRQGPPPHDMNRQGPPPHDMGRPGPPPHDMNRQGPPPHDMGRQGPPPHNMGRPGPPLAPALLATPPGPPPDALGAQGALPTAGAQVLPAAPGPAPAAPPAPIGPVAPNMNKERPSAPVETKKRDNDDVCIRMTGLHFRCSNRDVEQFFSSSRITPDGVKFVKNNQGMLTGEAFIKFYSKKDRDDAMRKNKTYMGRRFIQVYQCTEDEWRNMGQSSSPARRRSKSPRRRSRSPSRRGRSPPRSSSKSSPRSRSRGHSPTRSRGSSPSRNSRRRRSRSRSPVKETTTCLELKGLPSDVKEKDIIDLFRGVALVPNSIFIDCGEDGKAKGNAYARLANQRDMRSALNRDGRTISRKKISVHDIATNVMQAKVGEIQKVARLAALKNKKSTEQDSKQSPAQKDTKKSPENKPKAPTKENSKPKSEPSPKPPAVKPQDSAKKTMQEKKPATTQAQKPSSQLTSQPKPLISSPPPSKPPSLLTRGKQQQTPHQQQGLLPLPNIPPLVDGKQKQQQEPQQKAPVTEDDLNARSCVHVRNLPFHVTENEVLDFFKDLDIVPPGLVFMLNPDGSPSGQAYMALSNQQEAMKAGERRTGSVRGRKVIISLVPKYAMLQAIGMGHTIPNLPDKSQNQGPGSEGQGPPSGFQKPPDQGPGPQRQGGPSGDPGAKATPPGTPRSLNGNQSTPGRPLIPESPQSPDGRHPIPLPPLAVLIEQKRIVEATNLPFDLPVDGVVELFQKYKVIPESVRFKNGPGGRPTGAAIAAFPTPQDAKNAIDGVANSLVTGRTGGSRFVKCHHLKKVVRTHPYHPDRFRRP